MRELMFAFRSLLRTPVVTSAAVLSVALATLVLAGVAVCAGLIPARRAARVDPMTALRYE